LNIVLDFLKNNRQRLNLERYGAPEELSYVVLTPRFRTSNNVVFLMLAKGQPSPVLVVKMPRLAGDNASIEREAANLLAVQASRPGGFDSIPCVVAFEQHHDRPILVETALVGQPMNRTAVRHDSASACEAVTRWLTGVQQPTSSPTSVDPHWFERLVKAPLRHFANTFPLSAGEAQLLEQTWELIQPLRDASVPLVFEHGDLSHPNILLLEDGEVGVIDWELAEPHGLPACDLFFFLSYAAFARHNAYSNDDCLSAFHTAFFGPQAWTRPYIEDYATQLGLPLHLLTPLFVLCWARYTAGLLLRLGHTEVPQAPLDPDTVTWLRASRYLALWQYTLAHVNELGWHELSTSHQRNSAQRSTPREEIESL
jgi:aminoglycoside phosphotransferase (APT) family kinase protein